MRSPLRRTVPALAGPVGVAATAAPVVVTGARVRARRPGTGKIAVGAGIVLTVLLAGIVVPMLSPHDPVAQDLGSRLLPPSAEHWFGTDALGRDVFVRALAAARIDITLALVGALLPALTGSVIGALAGYAGRWADGILMRVADLVQAFPGYVFFLVVAFVVGPGVQAFLCAALLIAWVPYARLIRSQVSLIRELDYVKAARTSGVGHRRVLLRHVLPNALPQTIVYFASDVVFCLLALAGLSFLGVGIAPPTPEWGAMIAEGQPYLRTVWWMSAVPGVMIVAVGGAFALISDGIDERRRI